MVFADNQGNITYRGEKLTKMGSIKAHDDYILKTQFSPNNRFLATCSADKKIKIFKVAIDNNKFEVTEHKILKGHLRWVWDCQFSCDSAYLISCSTDMTIKLW
jgi:G protein beta subunit-like protein